MNSTVFSSRPFIEAWCSHFGGNTEPEEIMPVGQSTPDAAFGVATVGRTGLRAVDFAPEGFYASPSGELSQQVVRSALQRLQRWGVRRFVWNVRFDHGELAAELAKHLAPAERPTTHVLTLADGHDATFRQYNATIRNQVRRAHRSGVAVRASSGDQIETDLQSYYAIHLQHIDRKGGFEFVYPRAFLGELLSSPSARLLVATVDEQVVAGGIFVRDGSSVYYFHGAYDNEYSRVFPTCAVLDEAIRWAHEIGAVTFNFGGSGGIESLERFKSFWGAKKVENWRYCWRNPLWRPLDHVARWGKS